MQIKTNSQPRDVVPGYALPREARSEFDYLNWEAIHTGEASADFFRYKGVWYDLGEFMGTFNLPDDSPLKAWDGYHTDSFFSAIVVRYVDDGEGVVVGLALA